VVALVVALVLGLSPSARAQDRVAKAKELFQSAQKALAAGNEADAKALLEQAVEQVDRFTDAHYLLGVVLAREERWQDALAHFEKALAVEPSHPRSLYGQGACKRALGDRDGARAALERAKATYDLSLSRPSAPAAAVDAQRRERAAVLVELALLARDEGDEKAEAEALDHALDDDARSAKALAAKGDLLLRRGDAKGAVELLERARAIDARDLASLWALGRALVAARRDDEGRAKLDEYRKLDDERRARLTAERRRTLALKAALRAEDALAAGRLDEAAALARKALEADAECERARRVLERTAGQ
jgi:tetratricopeptide (TPR) repeat protein